MTHLAMQEADDDGRAVTWAEQVTDEEYNDLTAEDAGRAETAAPE